MCNYIKLTGTGHYLPGVPVPIDTIHDVLGPLEDVPRKIKRWIGSTTSIMKELVETKYYYYAIDPETREFTDDNLSMSVKAAKIALDNAGLKPDDVDVIIYGGPYLYQMPCLSVRIQEELGIAHCAELSIQSNCTSAYKALMIAQDFLTVDRYNNALVISSNMPSSQLRSEHFNQAVAVKEDIFLRWFLCDGAGAIVLTSEENQSKGFYLEHTYMESIGGNKPAAMLTGWPAYYMNPLEIYEKGLHHLKQMFRTELRNHFHEEEGTVFYKGLKRMIEKYSINIDKIAHFQINMPSKHIVDLIIEECESLGIKPDTMYSPIGEVGYTGPPASLISLDTLIHKKQFTHNDIILSFVTEVSKFMQAGFTFRYHQ